MNARKVVVWSGLLAVGLLMGPALSAALADEEGKRVMEKTVVVDKDGKATVHVRVPGGKAARYKKLVRMEAVAAKPGGGWMGVSVSPVPAAVAAQLDLKGRGVMVRNIVKGSPADKAGLMRYDVIVAAGRKEVSSKVEDFIDRVTRHKPGQEIPLTVLRRGEKRDVEIVLGKPMPRERVKYLYEDEADETLQDVFKLHRGLIRKGDGGWVIVGPEGTVKLPMEIKELLETKELFPDKAFSDVHVKVDSGGGKVSFQLKRTIDGETIEISSARGGKIDVRKAKKTDKGQQTSVITYKDADELRKKDPEAYELYKNITVRRKGFGKSITLPVKPPDIASVQEAVRKAERYVKAAAERAKRDAKTAAERLRAVRPFPREKVEREFKVQEDGSIDVSVREGGTAMEITFKNEAEMKDRAPKLYTVYRKLLADQVR